MTKTAQALAEWLSDFGLPVYLNTDVPDGAEPPYITIPLAEPEWRSKCPFQLLVWYRTTSNLPALQKADEILGAVGEGVRIYLDNGGLLVLRADSDTPIEVMVDGNYRAARIALTLNAYHLPGV